MQPSEAMTGLGIRGPAMPALESTKTAEPDESKHSSLLIEETRVWVEKLESLFSDEDSDGPAEYLASPPTDVLDAEWLGLLEEAQEQVNIEETTNSFSSWPTRPTYGRSARLSSLPMLAAESRPKSRAQRQSSQFPKPPPLRFISDRAYISGPPSAPLPCRPNWLEEQQQQQRRQSTVGLDWSHPNFVETPISYALSGARSRSCSNSTTASAASSALFSPRTSNLSETSAFTEITEEDLCEGSLDQKRHSDQGDVTLLASHQFRCNENQNDIENDFEAIVHWGVAL